MTIAKMNRSLRMRVTSARTTCRAYSRLTRGSAMSAELFTEGDAAGPSVPARHSEPRLSSVRRPSRHQLIPGCAGATPADLPPRTPARSRGRRKTGGAARGQQRAPRKRAESAPDAAGAGRESDAGRSAVGGEDMRGHDVQAGLQRVNTESGDRDGREVDSRVRGLRAPAPNAATQVRPTSAKMAILATATSGRREPMRAINQALSRLPTTPARLKTRPLRTAWSSANPPTSAPAAPS